jgi:hypothetical protein
MDWIRSDRLASSTGEHSTRLAGHVSARQDQYVERIELHIGGTVLQQAENRLTASVERHHLSVDYSFIRQLLQCCHNAGIAFSEVLVVAGPEPDLSAALDRQRPIAVELDLVLPAVALGQLSRSAARASVDKPGCSFCAGHNQRTAQLGTRGSDERAEGRLSIL